MNKPMTALLSMTLAAVFITGCKDKPAEDDHDHAAHSGTDAHGDAEKHEALEGHQGDHGDKEHADEKPAVKAAVKTEGAQ